MDFGSSSADRDRINASACHWTCQICRFAGSITVKSVSTADLSNGREGPLASRTGVPHTVPLGATVCDAFPPFPPTKNRQVTCTASSKPGDRGLEVGGCVVLGRALWRMAHFPWATDQQLCRTGSGETQLFGCQPLALLTNPPSPCTVEQLTHCQGPSLVLPSVEQLYVPLRLLIRGTISTLSRYDQQTNGEGP